MRHVAVQSWGIIKRGFGHTIFIWTIAQAIDAIGWCPKAGEAVGEHLPALFGLTTATNALIEMLLISTKPDLFTPCDDESPMLPLEEEDK